MKEILLFEKLFFPIVDTCLSFKHIARQSCAMVPTWRFFLCNEDDDDDDDGVCVADDGDGDVLRDVHLLRRCPVCHRHRGCGERPLSLGDRRAVT